MVLIPSLSLASIDANLRYGAKGTQVTELQKFLINKGFLSGQASGSFFSLTQKAVAAYQKSISLPTTGFVGPMTRVKINEELAQTSASLSVVADSSKSSIQQVIPQQQPIVPTNSTLCNGAYYSSCSTGNDFVCPVNGGTAYCQPSQQQIDIEAQARAEAQRQADLKQQADQQAANNQAQARYQTQYQSVQAKISPLQAQYDALKAIFLSQECSGFAGGEQGIKCLLASSQAGDVSEYENAIQNDFITPVTDKSTAYENQLDNLFQQIFQVKMDYHQQIANIDRSPIGLSAQNGEKQNALIAANAKINALNSQIQTLRLGY